MSGIPKKSEDLRGKDNSKPPEDPNAIKKAVFQASYEYEGVRNAFEISETIKKNFLLPCWIQRQDPHTMKDSTEAESYLTMLDSNTYKWCNKNRQIKWIRQDQIQLELLETKRKTQAQEKDQSKNPEIKNFKQQAGEILQKWKAVLNFLREKQKDEQQKIFLNQVKKGRTQKVHFFQRIMKGTFKNQSEVQQILVGEYFLLRYFDENEQNNQKDYKQDPDYEIKQYKETNKIYVIEPTGKKQAPYQVKKSHFTLKINMKFKRGPLKKVRQIIYYSMPENKLVQQLNISFTIDDDDQFLRSIGARKQLQNQKQEQPNSVKKQKHEAESQLKQHSKIEKPEEKYHKLTCFMRENLTWEIPPLHNRNQITYPNQQCKFLRNQLTLTKHFHLAFQGGGAKGLAYVGAYKSIRKLRDGDKEIPIKSIMGSSAGGIIALAISTGIPEYQLQKICYKMNNIPSEDRYPPKNEQKSEDEKATDQFGNQITMEIVQGRIFKLLQEYGIIKQSGLRNILSHLDSDQGRNLMNNLFKFLEAQNPAIGQILKKQDRERDPKNPNNCSLNLQGLFLHGALMKGEAINQIAQQCLIKFFIKKQFLQPEPETFEHDVKQALEIEDQKQKWNTKKIIELLNNHLHFSKKLLSTNLFDIKKICNNDSQLIKKFIAGVLNRFIRLIDDYLKLQSRNNKQIKRPSGLVIFKKQPNQQQQQNKKIKSIFEEKTKKPIQLNRQQIRQKIPSIKTNLLEYFKSQFCIKLGLIQLKGYENKRNPTTLEQNQHLIQQAYEQKKQKIMIPLFKQLDEMPQITYSSLNSILKTQNLINPADIQYDQKDKKDNTSITQIISSYLEKLPGQFDVDQFFAQKIDKLKTEIPQKQKENYEKAKAQRLKQLDSLFYSIQGQQAIYEVYKLLKSQKQLEIPEKVKQYQDNLMKLKEQVGKITMLQYYRLTQIQLSCTSVDLDNKVLRFFNHKTTPKLPVCRSVQMTGSFPFGFKAQRWKKEWGKYYVSLQQQKMQIDLTGHEFTDGGLLANFPIKYMDNQVIRKRYFTQKAVQKQTILLGFGLDAIGPSQYQLTEKQAEEKIKQKNKSKEYFALLKDIGMRFKLSIAKSLWWNTSTQKNNSQKWSQLSHWIMNQIPFVRFALKIASAYPNADRNLNLEAFQNKVLVQQIQPEWEDQTRHKENIVALHGAFLKEFKDYYFDHIYDDKHKPNLQKIHDFSVVKIRKTYKSQKVLTHEEIPNVLKDNINKHLKQRAQSLYNRKQEIKNAYFKLIENQGIYLFQLLYQKQVKKQTGIMEAEQINQQENEAEKKKKNQAFQAQLTKQVIKILLIHLKMPLNNQVALLFSKHYAFMKFVAEDFEYVPRSQLTSIGGATNDFLKEIDREVSKINFDNLYNNYQFEEISRHLKFQDYGTDYYKGLIKKNKNKSADKYFLQKRKEDKKTFNKNFDEPFFDLKLFDVRESIKRLTQLIYLIVKGKKHINKGGVSLNDKKQYRKLTNFIKNTSYQHLFTNRQNPIRYHEVLAFLKEQIAAFKKNERIGFNLSHTFQTFITSYELKSYTNNYKQYLYKLLYHQQNTLRKLNQKVKEESESGQLKELKKIDSNLTKNRLQGIKQYLKKEYKFINKFKSQEEFRNRMIYMLTQQIQKYAIESKGKSTKINRKTSKMIKEILNIKSKNGQTVELERIQQFLYFIFATDFTNEIKGKKISYQRAQEIERKKIKAIDSLLYLLRDPSQSADNHNNQLLKKEEQINYYKNVHSFEAFVKGCMNKGNIEKKDEQAQKNKSDDQRIEQALDKWAKKQKWPKDKLLQQGNMADSYVLTIIQLQTIKESLQQKLNMRIQKDNKFKLDEIDKIREEGKQKRKAQEGSSVTAVATTFWNKAKNLPILNNFVKSQEQIQRQENESILKKNVQALRKLNSYYFKDMSYFLSSLKEIIFLLRAQQGLLGNMSIKLATVYTYIFRKFSENYYNLEQRPINEITQEAICSAFIIELQQVKTMTEHFGKIVNKIINSYTSVQKKLVNKQQLSKGQKIIKYAFEIISKLRRHKLANALLNVDWKVFIIKGIQTYQRKVISILALQNFKKIDDFQKTPKRYPLGKKVKKVDFFKGVDDKVHLILQGVGTANKYFACLYQSINSIFQGIQPSIKDQCTQKKGQQPQARGQQPQSKGLQSKITGQQSKITNEHSKIQFQQPKFKIQQPKIKVQQSKFTDQQSKIKQKQAKIKGQKGSKHKIKKSRDGYQQKIRAITSSNFHSLFGFLLSLGYTLEKIHKQMFKIKHITNYMEDQLKIKEYFNSYEWLNNTSNRSKELLKYLQIQNTNIFSRLQAFVEKDYELVSLKNQFEDIRQIYQHQREMIAQTQARILDQIALKISQTQSGFLSSRYAHEIAKKFGHDYTCNLNHKHTYKAKSLEAFLSFKTVAQKIFDTFGSLLYGIACNSFLKNYDFSIDQINGPIMAKGLIVNRLLSTFKLNKYIVEKLRQQKIPQNITLSQFYQTASRQIFLNFTVIDVDRQRLTFLNKKTMPNMPVWAALIATSTAPFTHSFFEANKGWEAPHTSSFYSYCVSQFFKVQQDTSSRVTKYISGNFISSVPLELLTNHTIRKEILDQDIQNLSQFALCFNASNDLPNIVDLKIQKKYLDITFKNLWSIAFPGKANTDDSFFKSQQHKNNRYNTKYSVLQPLSNWLGQTALMSTGSILSNSNDNLIFKWYSDKLVKLPIKIGTLDFHQIVDKATLDTYLVNVLSEKAYETIERSEEITSSFIHNIVLRISGSQVKNQGQKQKHERFKMKLRIQIFEKMHPETGFLRRNFRLSFLNHSKWNQNNYNNFLVHYRVDEGQNLYLNKPFTKANDSQIVWLVQSNTKIQLKIYYLLKNSEYSTEDEIAEEDKGKLQIIQTYLKIDFADIVQKLPLKDSYDYEILVGWPDQVIQQRKNFYDSTHVISNDEQLKIASLPVKINRLASLRTKKGPEIKYDYLQTKMDDAISTEIIKQTKLHPKGQGKQI